MSFRTCAYENGSSPSHISVVMQRHTRERPKQILRPKSSPTPRSALLFKVKRVRFLDMSQVAALSRRRCNLPHPLVQQHMTKETKLILTGGRLFRSRPQFTFENHLCCFTSLAPLRLPSRVRSSLSSKRVMQSLAALQHQNPISANHFDSVRINIVQLTVKLSACHGIALPPCGYC